MMRKKILAGFVIALGLAAGYVDEAPAEIELTECLTLNGFLRYEIGKHIGNANPNNAGQENFDLQLARGFLVTELAWEPSDNFKLFAKPRFSWDTTARWDEDLDEYNAYPVDVPEDDWTMMKASDNEVRAEVWELYADLRVENLWLRLGKQQIVWGEMIGGRFLDIINPLDLSWNFNFEPEEFENIRIPQWMIRASYLIPQTLVDELSVEGFVNPGDVVPQVTADYGAPFNVIGRFPPFFRTTNKDRRGNVEYGFRVGFMIAPVYSTLIYAHVFEDSFKLQTTGFVPDPVFGVPIFAAQGNMTRYAFLIDEVYEPTDIYGLSLNYDIPYPFNLVFTFEGTWVPNQPYTDRESPVPDIRDDGTFNYALRIDRNTQIFPSRFLGTDFPFAALLFQVQGNVREGNVDELSGPGNSEVDSSDTYLVFKVTQNFSHNIWSPAFQVVYDIDGGYMLKPSLRYNPTTEWYFDLVGVVLGGSDDRPGRFGASEFMNEIFGRVTYQF